jgi:hypothetical protein
MTGRGGEMGRIQREDGPRAVASDIRKYVALLRRQEEECRWAGDIFQGAGYARIRRTLLDGYLGPEPAPRDGAREGQMRPCHECDDAYYIADYRPGGMGTLPCPICHGAEYTAEISKRLEAASKATLPRKMLWTDIAIRDQRA